MKGYVLTHNKSIKLELLTEFLNRLSFGFMEYILVHEVNICLYVLMYRHAAIATSKLINRIGKV